MDGIFEQVLGISNVHTPPQNAFMFAAECKGKDTRKSLAPHVELDDKTNI